MVRSQTKLACAIPLLQKVRVMRKMCILNIIVYIPINAEATLDSLFVVFWVLDKVPAMKNIAE